MVFYISPDVIICNAATTLALEIMVKMQKINIILVEQSLCESCMLIHNIKYLIQKATSALEEFLSQKILFMKK